MNEGRLTQLEEDRMSRRIEREAEIRALAVTNGRRLMSDGHYSTVMLGWDDIQMLLGEIDRLRGLNG